MLLLLPLLLLAPCLAAAAAATLLLLLLLDGSVYRPPHALLLEARLEGSVTLLHAHTHMRHITLSLMLQTVTLCVVTHTS